MSDEYTYTVSQIAKKINVKPHTLRRWDASGYISPTFVTASGQRRYKLSDVEAQLKEHEGRTYLEYKNDKPHTEKKEVEILLSPIQVVEFLGITKDKLLILEERGYVKAEESTKRGHRRYKKSTLERDLPRIREQLTTYRIHYDSYKETILEKGDKWLNSEEASFELQISRYTLRMWDKEGFFAPDDWTDKSKPRYKLSSIEKHIDKMRDGLRHIPTPKEPILLGKFGNTLKGTFKVLSEKEIDLKLEDYDYIE
jgi:DNA-binding transcriptional MerR regulator